MAQGDFEEVLAAVRPKTTTVSVCLRGDLLDAHERLSHELTEAQRTDELENTPNKAPGVARRIAELEAEIDATQAEFTFAAIGQRAWSDLILKHPPNDQDEKEGYEFDPRTFPVAAMAASAVSPAMTEAQAERLYAALNLGQWNQLWSACLATNVVGTSVPFSAAASATLRGFESSNEQPTTTESPAASSSGE